ncbi:Chromo domain [Trypanosoma melophagium]|uniref:Chromo domain n=1 Tax=Trypanosoma melophagium TaxID=715481 RepID=UPI00351AA3AB|nr:Chromo domain [Trypanosoma melophagium]
MRQYNVREIHGRRVNPDDGTLEYCVRWDGYDSLCDTWEPRSNLAVSCAGPITDIDSHAHHTALQRIAVWANSRRATKHGRNDSNSSDKIDDNDNNDEITNTPPVHAIVVHTTSTDSSGNSGETSLVGLGERVLTGGVSRGLNPTKKKRAPGPQEYEPSCDPALLLEKRWREQHAISFMHNCTVATSRTPAALEFELGSGMDACHDASSIEIHGIAPAILVKSGQVYSDVASCAPLIGREEAEHLRTQCNFSPTLARTTQELIRGKRDRLVVRYFLGEGDDEHDRTLYTMPLSVFRRFYPQLLLDYLLRHTLVMESP